MKKSRTILGFRVKPEKVILLFLILLVTSAKGDSCYGQNFLNLNFSGIQTAQIIPKNLVINQNSRYLIYDKVNPSSIAFPIIGLTKISPSDQVQFDIQIDLSNNASLFYDHDIHAVDVEVFENFVFVLASVSSRYFLLLKFDKNNGNLLSKEFINISPSNLSFHSDNTVPVDLYIGNSGNVSIDPNSPSIDPYICILAEASDQIDGQIVLLYRKLSESTYSGLCFDAPYSSVFNQSHIMDFGKGSSYASNDRVRIMAVNSGKAITVFNFDFSTVTMRVNFEVLDPNGNSTISVAKQFYLDGIDQFYGQINNLNRPGDFGSFFVINGLGSQPHSFLNSGFKLVRGESHPNDIDFNMTQMEGHASTCYTSFSGLYYDPYDATHPRYVVGYLDCNRVYSDIPPIAFSNVLRPAVPTAFDNIQNNFGASSYSGSTNQISAFLYRKQTASSNASNSYYLNHLDGATSCNSSINFIPGPQIEYYSTENYVQTRFRSSSNFNIDNDFAMNYNVVSPSILSGVCVEPLTDSYDPPPTDYWDPECGCFHLPPNINTKKLERAEAPKETDVKGVHISPNPARNQILIRAENEMKQIIIFDESGRKLITKSEVNQKQVVIAVEQLASGNYIVNVVLANGKQANGKLIKL